MRSCSKIIIKFLTIKLQAFLFIISLSATIDINTPGGFGPVVKTMDRKYVTTSGRGFKSLRRRRTFSKKSDAFRAWTSAFQVEGIALCNISTLCFWTFCIISPLSLWTAVMERTNCSLVGKKACIPRWTLSWAIWTLLVILLIVCWMYVVVRSDLDQC